MSIQNICFQDFNLNIRAFKAFVSQDQNVGLFFILKDYFTLRVGLDENAAKKCERS
jgi:hypothetical protein